MPSQINVAWSNSNPAAEPGKRLAKIQQADGDPVLRSIEVDNLGGVDARTTTTETIDAASFGMCVALANAAAIAVTLDSTVPAHFMCAVRKDGAGTPTLTPSSGTINGAASLAMSGDGWLFFDGTDWRFLAGGGGSTASPLTTKGDIWVYGSADDRLGVGSNGQVLTADSTQAKGIKWATPSGGTGSSKYWLEPPSWASASDDEFDGASLDASWTEVANTAASVHFATVFPSCLAVKFSGASQQYAISKAFAPPGDFSVLISFGFGFLTTNYAYLSVQLGDSVDPFSVAGANAWSIGLQYNGGRRLTAHKRVAGVNSFNVFDQTSWASQSAFLLIQRVSGVWMVYWAEDSRLGNFAPLSRNLAFNPTVNYVMIGMGTDSQTAPCMPVVDFIRFNQFFHL
jgi:hypothetical protein